MSKVSEALASYAHEAWSGWMKYQETKAPDFWSSLPSVLAERWQRQMNTPYSELPEYEKDSDREEAARMLAIVRRAPDSDLLDLLREARDAIDHMSESASGSLNPNDWADALIAAEEIATRLDAKIREMEGEK